MESDWHDSRLMDRVRRLIVLHITSSGYTVDELADAAITLIRAETLEEAARVAEGWNAVGVHIAAAIRARCGAEARAALEERK